MALLAAAGCFFLMASPVSASFVEYHITEGVLTMDLDGTGSFSPFVFDWGSIETTNPCDVTTGTNSLLVTTNLGRSTFEIVGATFHHDYFEISSEPGTNFTLLVTDAFTVDEFFEPGTGPLAQVGTTTTYTVDGVIVLIAEISSDDDTDPCAFHPECDLALVLDINVAASEYHPTTDTYTIEGPIAQFIPLTTCQFPWATFETSGTGSIQGLTLQA
jgi:hypothetical protein